MQQRTDERLQQCLAEGDYPGAIQLLLEAQVASKTFKHFTAIEQLSVKLQDTLELAEEQLDVALSKVCVDFRQTEYAKLQEAYGLLGKSISPLGLYRYIRVNRNVFFLGKTQTSMDQLQMHSASAVHNTAWNVVYGHAALCQQTQSDQQDVTGELSKKLYGDLCGYVECSSLLPCLVDLCRSLCSIMESYKRIYHWHEIQTAEGMTLAMGC